MSYTVATGYRKPVYTFRTNEEASRFNDELLMKTKVRGAIVINDAQPTYLYDSNSKLIRV